MREFTIYVETLNNLYPPVAAITVDDEANDSDIDAAAREALQQIVWWREEVAR